MDRTYKWLVTGSLLLAAATASADEQAQPPVSSSAEDGDSIASLFGATEPISAASLDEMSGKARLEVDKIQVTNQELNGAVTDNVATNNQTGHNTISTGAYQDASGFITTIQNTGNNVLIQNATVINVSVEP